MTKLNENYLRFCEEYVANDYNGTKAYCIAYDTKEKQTASVAASKMLRDPRVIEQIKLVEGDYRVIGHRLGVDKKMLLLRLKDLLSAKKQVFYNGEEIGTTDDNAAVTKAIEVLLKIYGDFSPEKKEITIQDDESAVDISKLTPEERKEYKDKLLRTL